MAMTKRGDPGNRPGPVKAAGRQLRDEKIDPTLPFVEIEIGGKTYKMCFSFRAIVKRVASGCVRWVSQRTSRARSSISISTISCHWQQPGCQPTIRS